MTTISVDLKLLDGLTAGLYPSRTSVAPVLLRRESGAPTATPADDPSSPSAAFQLLGKPVWRFLSRLGVASANLDDATQDVFVAVIRNWHSFVGASSRKSWVFGIAVKVASNHRRAQLRPIESKTSLLSEHHDYCASAQPGSAISARDTQDPLEAAARSEAGAFLSQFLAPLQENERSLFVLVSMEGFKVPEVAATLELSSRRAHTILERIHRNLETALRSQKLGSRAKP